MSSRKDQRGFALGRIDFGLWRILYSFKERVSQTPDIPAVKGGIFNVLIAVS